MRVLAPALCAALLLTFSSPAAGQQPAQSTERNLLAAIRLWGDIKLFDPDIADGGLDWDAALMNAEPSLAAATTAQAYRAAIATMLAPLHDPATHVEDDTASGTARIAAATTGNATVITIPHGVTASYTSIAADVVTAVAAASKTATTVFDLRGVNERAAGDAEALDYAFSPDSPVVDLISGSVTLPREGSRSYLGYPNEVGGGYQGYSARETISDGLAVPGRSKTPRAFAFVVDSGTSLPSMAIALAVAGDGAIYTTGGSPAMLAPSSGEIDLPFGTGVTYRTGNLPDFAAALQLQTIRDPADAVRRLASTPAIAASYVRAELPAFKDNPYPDATFPSEPMRILAIARIYNVIRYFSPYTALMHDDWDAAAIQAIADERSATDSRSYLLGLMKFYAHLHDSHGFVGGPLAKAEFGYGVPFEARYLHRQVVVTAATALAQEAGLRVGDVVDAIDGVSVRRAMDDAERYVSTSTQQAADYTALRSAFQPSIFSGPDGTPIAVTFHGARGGGRTVTFVRQSYALPPSRTGSKYFVLPGNVGYVDFDRIEPSEVDAMFDALKNTRAIVFDNRGYPRGAAWAIAPRLTSQTNVRAALFDTPYVANPIDARRSEIEFLPAYREFYQFLPAASGWRYLKPTVMLIDERAISQSEHSALFLQAANHTRFVGTPTLGANGDVTSMVVPGALRFSFTGEGVRHANGDRLQRVGIIPDVRVEPTAADIANHSDVVLQAGLGEALRLAGADSRARNAAIRQEIARERSVPAAGPDIVAAGESAQPLSLAWSVGSPAYTGATAAGAGYHGSDELNLASIATGDANAAFGSFAGKLDIAPYRGKTIRIRGYLSAQDVTGGVGFWLRIDGPSRQFDNMQDRWLAGTSNWKPFAIVLHVPADATQAVTGLLLVGRGAAHASALTIDVVPDSTPTTGQ